MARKVWETFPAAESLNLTNWKILRRNRTKHSGALGAVEERMKSNFSDQ